MKDIIREKLAFEDLTPEEKEKRGILGRLYGPIADIVNPTRNGRKYSEELWEQVFDNPIMKEKFKNKVMYGELGHPADREEIDMEKIAVCMAEPPKKDGNGHLIGYFDILSTPCGKILKTLCDYGSTLGISSRGTGDIITDEDGNEAVDPNTYDCECFDIVLIPAVESARLTFTESLQNKKTLKQALSESLEKANDEDKAIMRETLKELDIEIEDKEPIDVLKDKIDVHGEDDMIVIAEKGQLENPEAPKIEVEATEEEQEILEPEFHEEEKECNSEDCADIEDEESKKDEEDEEAIDDGSEELIASLKEAIKGKIELETAIKNLQEQLAVSNAKVSSLEAENSKINSTVVKLTAMVTESKKQLKKVSELEESLKKEKEKTATLEAAKDEKASRLDESYSKLREAVAIKGAKIKQLTNENMKLKESYESKLSDANNQLTEEKVRNKKLIDSLNSKVEKQSKLLETYKSRAYNVVERYINSKATMLGVSSDDIKSRLGESYTIDDIDKVCNNLREYELKLNSLPFKLENKAVLKVRESVNHTNGFTQKQVSEDDCDAGSLLYVAGVSKN